MRGRLVGAVAISLTFLAAPALAGGSWIDPDRESYSAGDTVKMEGGVSVGQLGWVEDGPFYAYLIVDPPADGAVTSGFPFVGDNDVPLGQLEISGVTTYSAHVSITFTLPEGLPDGEYWVTYCNDPCTEGLGDLIGGVLYVGVTAEEMASVAAGTTTIVAGGDDASAPGASTSSTASAGASTGSIALEAAGQTGDGSGPSSGLGWLAGAIAAVAITAGVIAWSRQRT